MTGFAVIAFLAGPNQSVSTLIPSIYDPLAGDTPWIYVDFHEIGLFHLQKLLNMNHSKTLSAFFINHLQLPIHSLTFFA